MTEIAFIASASRAGTFAPNEYTSESRLTIQCKYTNYFYINMHTRVISIANHKGGVAKSTTVGTVGPLLAKNGYKVLMVDLDAQCNLTDAFLKEESNKTIYDSFQGSQEDYTVNIRENLDILPSSLDMSAMDLMLSGRLEREKILKRILDRLIEKHHYDIILLDCPPSLGIITVNAFVASTDIYVATTPEYLPVKGLIRLEEIVELVSQGLNPNVIINGVIVTRYNSTKKLHVTVDRKIRNTYGFIVFKTRIRENIKLAECPMAYKDITEYAPDSNGAKDYQKLTEEIMDRL